MTSGSAPARTTSNTEVQCLRIDKPEVGEERVEAHRRSGITIKAYAAAIGVNPNTRLLHSTERAEANPGVVEGYRAAAGVSAGV